MTSQFSFRYTLRVYIYITSITQTRALFAHRSPLALIIYIICTFRALGDLSVRSLPPTPAQSTLSSSSIYHKRIYTYRYTYRYYIRVRCHRIVVFIISNIQFCIIHNIGIYTIYTKTIRYNARHVLKYS